MKISASFLSIQENIINSVKSLDKIPIDYLHLDVMDGIFVKNKTFNIEEMKDILKDTTKPKDVHLMVSDVKTYIDEYSQLKPIYITFHYEAVKNHLELINYIKSKGIKAGISLKPETKVEEIKHLLEFLDLVLIMSVEPGMGGQEFLDSSISKIYDLYDYRIANNYQYVIEVDGGINDKTKDYLERADILVVGSFITKGNYEEQLKKIRPGSANIVETAFLNNEKYQQYFITKFIFSMVKTNGNHLSEIEIFQLMFHPQKPFSTTFSNYEVQEVKNVCKVIREIYKRRIENKLKYNAELFVLINKTISEGMILRRSEPPKFVKVNFESEKQLVEYMMDIKNQGNVFYYIAEFLIAFYTYKPFKTYGLETMHIWINLALIRSSNAPIIFDKEINVKITEYLKNKDLENLEIYIKELSEKEMKNLKEYLR